MKPYQHDWKDKQIGTNGSEDNRWWKEFYKEYALKRNLVCSAMTLPKGVASMYTGNVGI
jgi:hypothetical protein